MKATPTMEFALYVEGLPEWYVQNTPAEFWTGEAFALFQAARQAGIIQFEGQFSDRWLAGPNYPKAALAYFCKRASRALHLNQGSRTNWQPFEQMFNPGSLRWPADEADTPPEHHPAAPLRLCLHNLEESGGQESKKDYIDRFFNERAK